MTRALGAVLVTLVGLAVNTPAYAQGPTIQAFAVGDSITFGLNAQFEPSGYGPPFEHKFEKQGLGKAGYRGSPGTNPCGSPWAQWIRDYPKARIDYVIIGR